MFKINDITEVNYDWLSKEDLRNFLGNYIKIFYVCPIFAYLKSK